MKILNTAPQSPVNPTFNGNWMNKIDKVLSKLTKQEEILTPQNQLNITKCTEIAKTLYDPTAPQVVNLNVKNGNKEFEFLFNNSAWHKVRLSKKGVELNEFEILHVKADNEFSLYSTGNYPCKISDKKFINKYNTLLEDWLPRLIKKYEKLALKEKKISSNI